MLVHYSIAVALVSIFMMHFAICDKSCTCSVIFKSMYVYAYGFFYGTQSTFNTISLLFCAIQCSTESMIFYTGGRGEVGDCYYFFVGGGGFGVQLFQLSN